MQSATKKVENADIIYFLGGLPDRMLDCIREFDLSGVLMKHTKIFMGYSAGASYSVGGIPFVARW